MRTLFVLIFILMAACDFNPEYATTPQTRVVIVNNQQLDAHALQVFDRLFGIEVDDGFYWVNEAGQWGHGSDTINPRGVINMEVLKQMQAEQDGQQLQGGGGQQVQGGGQQVQGGGGQQVQGGGGQQVQGGGAAPAARRGDRRSAPRRSRMPNGSSVNGSVVSGQLDGKNCTFVTASGGMTMKVCN